MTNCVCFEMKERAPNSKHKRTLFCFLYRTLLLFYYPDQWNHKALTMCSTKQSIAPYNLTSVPCVFEPSIRLYNYYSSRVLGFQDKKQDKNSYHYLYHIKSILPVCLQIAITWYFFASLHSSSEGVKRRKNKKCIKFVRIFYKSFCSGRLGEDKLMHQSLFAPES